MKRLGFTLIELLLALSLLSILMVALVNLIDTSLNIWSRTESERDLVEVGSAVLDLVGRDLAAVESGPRGDLLSEWWTYDVDGDATPGAVMARFRMVKRASKAELHRMGSAGDDNDLVQVVWALLPNPEGKPGESRSLGLLFRGERVVGDPDSLSFFDKGFFNAAGKAPAGSMNLVTGGVLWFDVAFATQTSIVHDGWSFNGQPQDCARSWDAWNKGRPDLDRSPWNEPGAGMPTTDEHPLLPRRVRIELEIERYDELRRRTRVRAPVETEAVLVQVDDPERLPEPGTMILIDEEWMELLSVSGDKANVRRGARGTTKRQHDAGALIHHGWSISREIAVPLHRDDWNL